MIQHTIPLADKTWFGTGGPARFYAQPNTADEFSQAIAYAQANELAIFILGHGANILISDEGFDGLVIHPTNTKITHTPDGQVTAGAGVSFSDLIDYCLAHNMVGLEEFSGIPGSVGGSVFINIHYFEFLLDQFFVGATLVNATTGALSTANKSWFRFGYDTSTLMQKTHYLVDATFQLKAVGELEAAYARGRRDEIIRHRRRRYPTARTCGSFFRNFHDYELGNNKLPYVAYYLDKLGVKGALRVGGAQVSRHHANMLVTDPQATSTDVIKLARSLQERVFSRFGIRPQPECQLIGFTNNPLN